MIRRDFVKCGVSALTAPVLARCGSTAGPDVDIPQLTARPGLPTVEPTEGLSDLAIDGGPTGILYVPTTYTGDSALPLMVGLHGAGGSSDGWASYHARAEARGLIFIAPDSSDYTWDLIAHGGFGPDVGRLNQALQYCFDRCRIDGNRIALGGFSDGASYALSLGVGNGDLFSHVIGYSPGFMVTGMGSIAKPRVFISHGTRDTILPIAASRNRIVPTLEGRGYDVTYQEFEGGHEVPAAISESALDWFLVNQASG
jgi:phospholipase/carboxylesterase